jgi:hypothetical protein
VIVDALTMSVANPTEKCAIKSWLRDKYVLTLSARLGLNRPVSTLFWEQDLFDTQK